jgi:hypothetical protein
VSAATDDPRLLAAVDLIARTGAEQFSIRYSDEEPPVVWMAYAEYAGNRREVDAAFEPLTAVLRLAERLIDGGVCQHCKRPAGLDPDSVGGKMPLDRLVCWYQFDPGAQKFIRGCAGDKP